MGNSAILHTMLLFFPLYYRLAKIKQLNQTTLLMNPNNKQSLSIELGTTPTQANQALQNIKDAMVLAIFQKIEATGIQDAQDVDFTIWQSIYLEAHFQTVQSSC